MTRLLNLHPISDHHIVTAKGSILKTTSGKELIDLQSGIWCVNIGHQNDIMLSTIQEQMDRTIHLNGSFCNPIADKLIETLGSIMGIHNPLGTFLSSGSEAVLLGIKLCKLSNPTKKIFTFHNAYLNAYNKDFNDDWITLDYTPCLTCSTPCTSKCPHISTIDFSAIGAFIFESVYSRLSIKPPVKLIDYLLSSLSEDVITMANEVTTGFGRTGTWFGFMHYPSFVPDIVALGKGLGNGYPISGIITKPQIYSLIENHNFTYVQSHQNDPLGCRIALSVINYIEDHNLINKSSEKSVRFVNRLQEMNLDYIKSIGSNGMLIAIEVADNKARYIFDYLYENGFFVGCYGNIIHIAPPLTIEEKHLDNLISNLIQIKTPIS